MLVDLAHGIGAALAAGALFYLAGVSVLPQRWISTNEGPLPVVVGAAIYTLACWIAVSARAIPLLYVIAGIVTAVALTASQRMKVVFAHVRLLNRSAFELLAGFVGFYVAAHLLLAPGRGEGFLALPSSGSLELITHAHHTRLLLENGSSSFSDAMFDVGQHPAVASLLAGFSFFFHRDTLVAAIPLQTAAAAATAMLVLTLARSAFALSLVTSALVAFIAVCAPLYKSAASASLLPTLLGIPVILCLILASLRTNPHRAIDSVAIYFASAYALLWLLDAWILCVAIAMQAGVMALMAFEGDEERAKVRRVATNSALALAVLAVVFHQRVAATPGFLTSYFESAPSYEAVGVISPLAVLGWPSASITQMRVEGPLRQTLALMAYLAISIALWLAYRRAISDATPMLRVLSRAGALAFVAAVLLFAVLGSSVGHWRLATMVLLPLAFVPLAVLANIVQFAPSRLRLRSSEDARLSRAAIVYAAVAVVLGNVVLSAYAGPPLAAPAAAWRGLDEIRKLRLQSVTVRLDEDSPELAALARYYLAGAKVDFMDAEAGIETATLEAISSKHPMFVQDAGCAAVGHDEVVGIPRLGCLIMAPPTVVLDRAYLFEGRFLFLAYQGLTARKAGGRWNADEAIELRITADPSKIPVDQDLHVNLLLNPFTTTGAQPRQLRVEWSNGESADFELAARDWISAPVRGGDWTGNRLWSVPIRIHVPDGRAILFEALSVTKGPAGSAVKRQL